MGTPMQEGSPENWRLWRPDKNTIVGPNVMVKFVQQGIPYHEEAVKWREGLRPALSVLRAGQPREHSVFRRMFLPRWHSTGIIQKKRTEIAGLQFSPRVAAVFSS